MKSIVVNLDEQTVEAFEDDNRVYAFICGRGMTTIPPTKGSFTSFASSIPTAARLTMCQWTTPCSSRRTGKPCTSTTGRCPSAWSGNVKQGVTEWFGSHGCVRLEENAARTLYEWAPLNTKVTIK